MQLSPVFLSGKLTLEKGHKRDKERNHHVINCAMFFSNELLTSNVIE